MTIILMTFVIINIFLHSIPTLSICSNDILLILHFSCSILFLALVLNYEAICIWNSCSNYIGFNNIYHNHNYSNNFSDNGLYINVIL
jgi:hypothetical protein